MEGKKNWKAQTGVRLSEFHRKLLSELARKRLSEGVDMADVRLSDFIREGLCLLFLQEGLLEPAHNHNQTFARA